MSQHKSKRPLIGITKPEARPLNLPYYALWFSVWLAGGKPIVLTPGKPVMPEHIDGLLLGGGTDIFPGLFMKEPKAGYHYDHPRDKMEMKWLRLADDEKIPVLAICRGAQLMNVVRKGNLHMDIEKVYEKAVYPNHLLGYLFFRKQIHIQKDSILFDLFEKETAYVNSLHRQSIADVGEELEVTARETNGIVQAIERKGHPFYLGVQFHPELLIYRKVFRNLFRRFINTARK
jgi:putative glutamine amidotransferase